MTTGEIDRWDPGWLNALDAREIFDELIEPAAARGVYDLFLTSTEDGVIVRARRFGALETITKLPQTEGVQLINLIKSVSDMDLAERRRPQDGRMTFVSDKCRADLRVNSIGCLHGEDLAIRIMDPETSFRNVDGIGLEHDQTQILKSMLDSPTGLMLFTGPTGCGKTTSIYACIDYLNDGTRMISTIEDPVELSVEGIRQIQVQPKRDLNFAPLLRGALRQAPDVIVIGEIRDAETAEIAVRAGNSGHLVLSSVHAGSAVGAIQTMLAHGANPYFLASSLLGVISQRLIRKLNPETRVAYDLFDSGEVAFESVKGHLTEGEGVAVFGPGESDANYIGITGMFEILVANKDIRKGIIEGKSKDHLHEIAVKNGMMDLRQAALLKLANGTTSVEEVARHIMTEDENA